MSNKNRRKRQKGIIVEDKVQLKVYISRDIYELLVELAPNIYGQYKGALSHVVEEALKVYLLPRQHTQIHTNPKLSVRNVYYKVKEKIKEITHNPVIFEVPEKILDLAISEIRGSDPRTIAKWKKLFIEQGLIKYVGGNYPNRIFELIA